MYFGANGNLLRLFGGPYLLALSVLPPLLALRALARGRYDEAAEGVACTLASIATTRWAIGLTKLPGRLALYQPLGAAFLAAITVNSTYRMLSGRGVEWRGRRYGKMTARIRAQDG